MTDSEKVQKHIYALMVLMKAADDRLSKGIATGEFMCVYWPSRGQEAIAAAMGVSLRQDDQLAHDHCRLRPLEVERQGALATVGGDEQRGKFPRCAHRLPAVAGDVAGERLDLDHLGTLIGEEAGQGPVSTADVEYVCAGHLGKQPGERRLFQGLVEP